MYTVLKNNNQKSDIFRPIVVFVQINSTLCSKMHTSTDVCTYMYFQWCGVLCKYICTCMHMYETSVSILAVFFTVRTIKYMLGQVS